MPTKQATMRVEDRRAQTAGLAREGMSYRQILKTMKADGYRTSLGTISSDLEELTARYRDQSFKSREESLLLDLDRLDAIMRGIWAGVAKGDSMAIDRALHIIELRTRMLGYEDVPMKESPAVAVATTDLTADEEAVLIGVLDAMRSGRSVPLVIEGAFRMPDDESEPVPLPPSYGRQEADDE